LWLYKTQTAEHLRAAMDRKEMLEELAVELAQSQIAEVRKAYQTAQPLFGGVIPTQTAKLINSFAVLDKAEQLAREMYKNATDSKQIEQAARKLILERPRKLQEALVKNTREAYSYYTDEQLACLLANKRINDYKTALINRAVQSIYSIGSTVWIIDQDRQNRLALAGIPCVEAHLAEIVSVGVAQTMLSESIA